MSTCTAAINATHGKLKRHITPLALGKALGVSLLNAKSLLFRMEHEKLVEKGPQSSYLGFKVNFTGICHCTPGYISKLIWRRTSSWEEENRALVRHAVQHAANLHQVGIQKTNTSHSSAQSLKHYQEESCAEDDTLSQRSFQANFPIVQTKRALKKRKLSLKSVAWKQQF
jgi:hypothetical protein